MRRGIVKSFCSKFIFLLFFFLAHGDACGGLTVINLKGYEGQNFLDIKVGFEIPNEEIDWERSFLKRNGHKVSWPRLVDGVFHIKEKKLAFGKYSYHFKIYNRRGRVKGELFIPVWFGTRFNWEDAIMYQIMIDRFNNGDLTNDSPSPGVPYKNNWQGGDFKGIVDKINSGFFHDLGVNVIYIIGLQINNLRLAG